MRLLFQGSSTHDLPMNIRAIDNALLHKSPPAVVSLDEPFFRKLNTSYSPVYKGLRKANSMTQTDISSTNFEKNSIA